MRTALGRLIVAAGGLQLAGAVESGEAAIAACRRQLPDVVLMDMRRSGIDGVRIVMLTSLESPRSVARARQAGAVADLLKETRSHTSLRRFARWPPPETSRQFTMAG